jgi:hypothetical protein
MKKFLKISLFVIIGLVVAFFGLRAYTKSHSPAQTVEVNHDGLIVKTSYSSPHKKGRVIFGELVPYGKVWRTGANEATLIEFNQAVKVAGKELKAGKYSLWSIPAAGDWTIIFNGETGQWGTNYDEEEDVLRVTVPSAKTPATAEQLAITFNKVPAGADMVLHWDNTAVTVPIRK